MKLRKTLPLFPVLFFLFYSCPAGEVLIEDTRLVLGTWCSVRIWGDGNRTRLENSFAILEDIENLMSPSLEGSDIYKLRQNAGTAPIKVHEDTMNVVLKGIEYYTLSEGYLDISIGPLVSLWNINSEDTVVPEKGRIEEALDNMGLTEVQIDKKKGEIYLPRHGMALELGAVAKGYASDKVAEYLKKSGIKKALINLGGNVYALGRKAPDKEWAIGIQNPFAAENRGKTVGLVRVADRAVISSGPYERKFYENGMRYHHILDPFTGFPIVNNIESISIICAKGVDGDALSTSLFALGVEKGLALAESLDDTEAVYITSDKKVLMTSGAAEIYRHLDSSFEFVTK
ncbi:MAG: FAD:protein FMN transferase [Spirochaetales bacterium]|nr:FAD:protein FMN transferase [Spirochaetales bacterium]